METLKPNVSYEAVYQTMCELAKYTQLYLAERDDKRRAALAHLLRSIIERAHLMMDEAQDGPRGEARV